ncbi:hypothetical protein [Bradyrhizobium sp. NAS96.2]|uniref:hypothetical protein n=1 Tax=Bradyrhizobium sp. NAS96.2 TaxID=1680160 RepID=UPI00116109D0|nr:hypothetical protein [Bradyrhizobium sp. NAS96.2]
MFEPMIYYVKQCKLFITINDGMIEDIEKAHRNSNPNNAITVRSLDVTTSAIAVSDENRLCLDGWALTDLMAWLYRRMPTASDKAFNDAFMRLFPNSMDITDILRATLRCATGNEHTAYGDCAYFCAKVREVHPEKFAELREAWKQQFN